MNNAKLKKMTKFTEPSHVFPSDLTAREQDVFAMLLCEMSKLWASKRKLENMPDSYSFTNEQIEEAFGFGHKNSSSKIRNQVFAAADSLGSKRLRYYDKLEGMVSTSLIPTAKYNNGILTLDVTKSATKVLSNYVQFAEIDLKTFVSMKGKHEKRLLKELCMWKRDPKHEYKFEISELRVLLNVVSTNKSFDNFKRRCIESPLEEIIKCSKGQWVATDKAGKGYELIKRGRSYTHVVFKMKYVEKPIDKELSEAPEERESFVMPKIEQVYKSAPIVESDDLEKELDAEMVCDDDDDDDEIERLLGLD